MTVVKVTTTYYDLGEPVSESFEKEFVSFDEIKKAFLKSFGNISASNKAEKDRDKVKYITKNANSFEDWIDSIKIETRWRIDVRILERGVSID